MRACVYTHVHTHSNTRVIQMNKETTNRGYGVWGFEPYENVTH